MTSSELLPALVALLCVGAVCTLMALAVRKRMAHRGELPAANQPPADLPIPFMAVEGEYISTTHAGRPLERVTDYGLGFKAPGSIDLHPEGLVLLRRGVPAVFIPAHDILRVERGSGMIGKFVERQGMAAVTWLLGHDEVVTGFRARYAADTQRFVEATHDFYSHTAHYREPATTGSAQRQEFDDHE